MDTPQEQYEILKQFLSIIAFTLLGFFAGYGIVSLIFDLRRGRNENQQDN